VRGDIYPVAINKKGPGFGALDLSIGYLGGDDVFRLWALLALCDGKFDSLAFGERFEAVTRNRTEVCKNVGARFLLDEAEAFGFVEPFNGSGSS
jgi:hypothetical protein